MAKDIILATMSQETQQKEDERRQIQLCQEGDPEALGSLRQAHQDKLTGILLSRGASRTETGDILADLWADCVPGNVERPSLLEKFSGKCSFQGWLATVATNRWIDYRRRQGRVVNLQAAGQAENEENPIERIPAGESASKEDALVDLLRDCLQSGFAACPTDAMVLMKLVYLHGLTQRELARMMGWSEFKISRLLSSAMKEIREGTMRAVRTRDAMLNLSWDDFLSLCESRNLGFL